MPELKAAIDSILSSQAIAALCAAGFLVVLEAVSLLIGLRAKGSHLATAYVAHPQNMTRGDIAWSAGFARRLPKPQRQPAADE